MDHVEPATDLNQHKPHTETSRPYVGWRTTATQHTSRLSSRCNEAPAKAVNSTPMGGLLGTLHQANQTICATDRSTD
jgi:hypothetical protein